MTQAGSNDAYGSNAGYTGGGYYSDGGYYGSPGPSNNLNAVSDLTGPGSTAYLHDGAYSSYASEGYNNNFYERNETQFSGGYLKSTSYYVGNQSYSDVHDTSNLYYSTPSYYNDDGSFNGVTDYYTSYSTQAYDHGGYETIGKQSFEQAIYGDGAYHSVYSSTSGTYENGMSVEGSMTSYSSSHYGYLPTYTS